MLLKVALQGTSRRRIHWQGWQSHIFSSRIKIETFVLHFLLIFPLKINKTTQRKKHSSAETFTKSRPSFILRGHMPKKEIRNHVFEFNLTKILKIQHFLSWPKEILNNTSSDLTLPVTRQYYFLGYDGVRVINGKFPAGM